MGEVERAIFPRGAGRSVGGLELRCVIFAHRDRRILLVRRRRHPLYEDAWTLPGGPVEYGVSLRESAARILWDQAGVTTDSMRLLGVQSAIEGDWILTFQFEAGTSSGDPAPGPGIAEVRFASPAERPQGLHPSSRTDLEKYLLHELAKSA